MSETGVYLSSRNLTFSFFRKRVRISRVLIPDSFSGYQYDIALLKLGRKRS